MKKFTESLNNVKKTEKLTLTYYSLFPLLKGLEQERPGIKDRIWEWMRDTVDSADDPINGRISYINLYYYGVGDEYPIKPSEKDEVEYSKKIHPEAFISGTKEETLRLDLNLIWSTYQDDMNEKTSRLDSPVEMFSVLVEW